MLPVTENYKSNAKQISRQKLEISCGRLFTWVFNSSGYIWVLAYVTEDSDTEYKGLRIKSRKPTWSCCNSLGSTEYHCFNLRKFLIYSFLPPLCCSLPLPLCALSFMLCYVFPSAWFLPYPLLLNYTKLVNTVHAFIFSVPFHFKVVLQILHFHLFC